MRRKTAVVLGVAGAALALTASSAFTAAGLNVSSTGTGFVGGSQTVTVDGTTVGSIVYKADSTTASKTGSIILTFNDHNANTKAPAIEINFASGSSATAPTDWTCSAIATSSTDSTKSVSKCGADAGVSGAAGTAFTTTELASIKLTVA